ncbi:glutamate--cysteine ligase [Gammaproteobacteria bacterium]|nr:glutamate--cysteine ligase [Gammaproteobacteria bacterium]
MNTSPQWLGLLANHRDRLETWWQAQSKLITLPYASVDVRDAGFKVAPIDTNLFPAGFNNLDEQACQQASTAFKQYWQARDKQIQHIALIMEPHDRNTFYHHHLAILYQIHQAAGFQVSLCYPSTNAPIESILSSQGPIAIHNLDVRDHQLLIDDQPVDAVLSNYDGTSGELSALNTLKIPCFPKQSLGWSTRHKHQNLLHYEQVAKEFGDLFGLDPWRLSPLFHYCKDVNFLAREGEDCLTHHVALLLKAITQKYQAYKIESKPYVVIKSDQGTYGMGVMTVHQPSDVKGLNRRTRTKMSQGKAGKPIQSVVLQEGIPSMITNQSGFPAEQVGYVVGSKLVGSFLRVHPAGNAVSSLNRPGMQFEPYSPSDNEYGAIWSIRLALLAAYREAQACP